MFDKLTDNELTALYASLVHSTNSGIFTPQGDDIRFASEKLLDEATDSMELRGLLIERGAEDEG